MRSSTLAAICLAAVSALAFTFPSMAGAYLAPGPSVPGVGTEPTSVQTADLNGDGRTDLVIPNTGSDNVSILLGNSSGEFTRAVGSPVASDGEPGSPEPVAVAIAPLNHDSIPDIAVVNKATDDVSIMLGNGTGRFSFAPGSPEPVGEEPVAITSGDFDSDGNTDLAVADEGSDEVTILKNDGAGGFNASSFGLGGGGGPRVITAGYFDENGSLDLAVAVDNGDLTIFNNNGNGFFSSSGPVPTGGSNPVSLESADLNGDSIPDLALLHENDSVISVLVGEGNGGFTEVSVPAFIGGARSLAVGDINGDGEPDLAVTNEFTSSILINEIPGLLEFFPLQFATIQGSANFVKIADLNGDENPDLVFAEPTLDSAYVVLSLPSIVFEPPEVSFGTQPTGLFGPPQGTIVHNLDPVARLQVSDDRVTGAERDDFLISSDECEGRTVDTEQTCEIRVRFGPVQEGNREAVLQVTDNAIEDAGAIPLDGVGGPPPHGDTGPTGPTGATGRDWSNWSDRGNGVHRCHRGDRSNWRDRRDWCDRSDWGNRGDRLDRRHGFDWRDRRDRRHRSNWRHGSDGPDRRHRSNWRHGPDGCNRRHRPDRPDRRHRSNWRHGRNWRNRRQRPDRRHRRDRRHGTDWSHRRNRCDRRNGRDRCDRPDRSHRRHRAERTLRPDRCDRTQRADRCHRTDWVGRKERADRAGRQPRGTRPQRTRRRPRPEGPRRGRHLQGQGRQEGRQEAQDQLHRHLRSLVDRDPCFGQHLPRQSHLRPRPCADPQPPGSGSTSWIADPRALQDHRPVHGRQRRDERVEQLDSRPLSRSAVWAGRSSTLCDPCESHSSRHIPGPTREA